MEIPLGTDTTLVSPGSGPLTSREIVTTFSDFLNGWDAGILQNAVDKCHCNPYGDVRICLCPRN